jgi:hypothetical protein
MGALGCRVATPKEGIEFYEVGETVPATTFVGATQVVEPLADGWSRVYLEGEDGSRWARSLRWGDVDCAAARAVDGLLRCLPNAAGSTFQAGFDADCKTRVAEGDRSSCSTDQIFLRDTDDTICPTRTAVRRASRRLDADYVSVNGTCHARQDPFREAYALGEALPPGNFPEVVLGTLDASGRLQREAASTSAGVYGYSSFWDSGLAVGCAAVLAKDGPRLVTTPFYADSQCARPVTTGNPCVFPVILTPVPDVCPERYRIFQIGAATVVEKPYVLDAGGRCVPASGTLPPSAVVHEVKELEPSELVELSLGP